MAMYIVFEVRLSDTKNEKKWKKCDFFYLGEIFCGIDYTNITGMSWNA